MIACEEAMSLADDITILIAIFMFLTFLAFLVWVAGR